MDVHVKKPYEKPRITRVILEDKPVIAQTACKDTVDNDACAELIRDDTGNVVKRLPGFDMSPS
ncbi:MAG: hypothetical protein NZ740_05560 [Kiritimatiellae bacterium]|nr:hypothetical protein [Kiritimatiellia bacterium]MDW8458560.1 hypothetical protein [Verrucomicrobiota bacterium]